MTTDKTRSTRGAAFRRAWCAPKTYRRALRVSAIVGTILVTINQGDLILSGGFPPTWKILMTYFVPYAVSSWSSAAAMIEQDAEKSERPDRPMERER